MPNLNDANKVANALKTMVEQSGKLQLLHKLLPRLRSEGRKLLIFSQMKRMLDLLEDYLALSALPYERLDGSVQQKERQAAIDRFQTGGPSEAVAFLLTTKAGGVGINLTAADTVIIFDSDWNPQNDLQGMARCHRIGQTNQVCVYRLLTSKTYETAMYNRACSKLALDAALTASSGNNDDDVEEENANGQSNNEGPSAAELSQVIRQGAYQVLKENRKKSEAASRAFASASIDELLARAQTVTYAAGGAASASGSAASRWSRRRGGGHGRCWGGGGGGGRGG